MVAVTTKRVSFHDELSKSIFMDSLRAIESHSIRCISQFFIDIESNGSEAIDKAVSKSKEVYGVDDKGYNIYSI